MDSLNVKAIILAGGRAQRLLPITAHLPKSLVPVLNTPFLDHVLCSLKHCGINDVTLACGHLSQSMQDHYTKQNLDINPKFVYEQEPLGTAGAVANAWDGQSQTIVVLNGDIFCDIDIRHLIEFHRKNKSSFTFLLTQIEDCSQYGVVEINQNGRVISFCEKPSYKVAVSNLINAGIYVMEACVLQRISVGQTVSFEKDIFPSLLLEGEQVYGYQSNAYWIDIGRPTDYMKLNFDLLSNKAKTFVPRPDGIYDEKKQLIAHKSAIIANNAQIKDSIIWNGCKIGSQAIIDSCVLCNKAFVSADCYIKNSILGQEAYVKEGEQLIDEKLDAFTVFG